MSKPVCSFNRLPTWAFCRDRGNYRLSYKENRANPANYTAMAAKTNIAQLVQAHRKAAGLSRAELSVLAGVGKTVLYDIEHGKTSVRFDTLCRVLDSLNIQIHFESPLAGKLDARS